MNGSTIITDLLLVYVVTQLLTTAYGLTVINTLKPLIEKRLEDRGYVEKQKNSLYQFNEKFYAILKGLIPCYYGVKALNLVQGREPIERAAEERIVTGEYITKDERMAMFEESALEKNDESLFIPKSNILFEKPEPYKARKPDYSLYNTYETPLEYVTREMSVDESLKLTPFVLREEAREIIKEEVTTKDVARFISQLSANELRLLRDKIDMLIELSEKEYTLSLDKMYDKEVA